MPLSLCKFTVLQRKGLFTTAIQSTLKRHVIPTFMLQKLNPTSTSQLPSFLRSAKLSQTKQKGEIIIIMSSIFDLIKPIVSLVLKRLYLDKKLKPKFNKPAENHIFVKKIRIILNL